jgi:hypothetical protein
MTNFRHRANHSKSVLRLCVFAFCVIVISAVVLFSFNAKPDIGQSRITFFNDLRSSAIDFEIKFNDAIVFKSPQDKNLQSTFYFPSENGRYVLETTINSKTEKHQFHIADNNSKYIYIGFADKNSSYINYFFKLRDSLIRKEVGNRSISRPDLDSLSRKIGNSITFSAIKAMGYNPDGTYLEMKILEQPYILD